MLYAIALALSLQNTPATQAPQLPFGRVYTSPTLHIGIRPNYYAATYESGFALTVQLSTNLL